MSKRTAIIVPATPDPGRRSPARVWHRTEKHNQVSQRPTGIAGYAAASKPDRLRRQLVRLIRTNQQIERRKAGERTGEYTPTKTGMRKR